MPLGVLGMVQLAFILYTALLTALVTGGVTAYVYERRLRALRAALPRRKSEETYREELDARLLHAQKLEALGRLTAGVAHDFNNLLMVIDGCVRMALSALHSVHPARKDLEQIEVAAQSAMSVTRQLMIFSRKDVARPALLDVNEIVVRLHAMLRRVIGEQIQFVVRPGHALGQVEVDASQIEQVMMNLLMNACDAMPGGGTLTVDTGAAALDERFAREHEMPAGGEFVKLSVSDTGVGMGPDTQARMFEPFFTTKAPGEGTGIGLATVKQIVRGAGGCIVVESAPGRGTTFTVYLPRR